MINALEAKGLVRRLAEPDLVALSGDTASFLAGGEFPVPVAQPAGGGVAVTVEYKRFGVQLTFMPTVLAKGLINLRLTPTVSEIDFTNAVVENGFRIPSLVTREARTTIELRDGQSFAIAGLLQAENRRDVSQLPWIGSVPVLGALFRSSSFQQRETDLIVIETPHLVAPAVPGQRLATPFENYLPSNDVDFCPAKWNYASAIATMWLVEEACGDLTAIYISTDSGPDPKRVELDHESQIHYRGAHTCGSLYVPKGYRLGPGSFNEYIQRSDTITFGAGEAKEVNSATHVIDPWPPYVGNRRIPGNGERMSDAVQRYRDVSKLPQAPRPISPATGDTGIAYPGERRRRRANEPMNMQAASGLQFQ